MTDAAVPDAATSFEALWQQRQADDAAAAATTGSAFVARVVDAYAAATQAGGLRSRSGSGGRSRSTVAPTRRGGSRSRSRSPSPSTGGNDGGDARPAAPFRPRPSTQTDGNRVRATPRLAGAATVAGLEREPRVSGGAGRAARAVKRKRAEAACPGQRRESGVSYASVVRRQPPRVVEMVSGRA